MGYAARDLDVDPFIVQVMIQGTRVRGNLTALEKDLVIMGLSERGHENGDIAERLGVSRRTVERRRQQMETSAWTALWERQSEDLQRLARSA